MKSESFSANAFYGLSQTGYSKVSCQEGVEHQDYELLLYHYFHTDSKCFLGWQLPRFGHNFFVHAAPPSLLCAIDVASAQVRILVYENWLGTSVAPEDTCLTSRPAEAFQSSYA